MYNRDYKRTDFIRLKWNPQHRLRLTKSTYHHHHGCPWLSFASCGNNISPFNCSFLCPKSLIPQGCIAWAPLSVFLWGLAREPRNRGQREENQGTSSPLSSLVLHFGCDPFRSWCQPLPLLSLFLFPFNRVVVMCPTGAGIWGTLSSLVTFLNAAHIAISDFFDKFSLIKLFWMELTSYWDFYKNKGTPADSAESMENGHNPSVSTFIPYSNTWLLTWACRLWSSLCNTSLKMGLLGLTVRLIPWVQRQDGQASGALWAIGKAYALDCPIRKMHYPWRISEKKVAAGVNQLEKDTLPSLAQPEPWLGKCRRTAFQSWIGPPGSAAAFEISCSGVKMQCFAASSGLIPHIVENKMETLWIFKFQFYFFLPESTWYFDSCCC